MSETATYAPGDIANGHILTSDGHWVPLPASLPAPSPVQLEAELDRRMKSSKTTAWLWWFFLGGINAHLAYIYPKWRFSIITGSILLLVLTWGISGLVWLGTWAFLLVDSNYQQLREHTRLQIEREWATRRALYS